MVVRRRELCDLAPEAFGQILSYLGPTDAYTLWMCGEKHLQERMRGCDGVKSFCLDRSDLARGVWPSVVREFCNLAVFRLDLAGMPDLTLGYAHLMQLASTVREVVLNRLTNGYWVFRGMISQNPWHFPNLEVLEIRQSRSNLDECLKKRVDWPSSLRKLTLQIPDDLDLCELPRGLEYLSFEGNSVLNVKEGHLPTLKELHVTISDLKFRWPVESLPPNLDTLDLSHEDNYASDTINYDDWNLANLPHGLTSLRAPIRHTKATLNALPRTLTYLDVSSGALVPDGVELLVEYWPPSLTYAAQLEPLYVTQHIAQRLPRGLRVLETEVSADALPYLPIGVAEVTVEGSLDGLNQEMEHLQLTTLPTPITMLTFSLLTKELDATFPLRLLPPSLTGLEFWTNKCSPTFWEALAQSQLLNQFQLKALHIDAHVSRESWHLFPRTLTALSFRCKMHGTPYFTTQDATTLPNTLTSLDIACQARDRFCFDLYSLAALPKSLQYLDTTVSLAKMPSSQEIGTVLSNVKDLHLRLQCGSLKALGILFASLPTSIQSLGLDSRDRIPLNIETLQRLPRELRVIRIHFPDFDFSRNHPRMLKSSLQDPSNQ